MIEIVAALKSRGRKIRFRGEAEVDERESWLTRSQMTHLRHRPRSCCHAQTPPPL